MTDTLSTFQFFNKFPNEESTRVYFENKRWAGKPTCGHCGSQEATECKDHKPMAYRCKKCRKHFSVRTGTVLSESRLPLQKWLLAIFMMTSARKGIPSTQMARELGITQKSAWFLAQRIRETWLSKSDNNDKADSCQIDETYIGGKEKNKHVKNKANAGRGTADKIAVVGMRNQDGQVTAKSVKNTKSETLITFIQDNANTGATIVTDTFPAYNKLSSKGFKHISINHSAGEYIKEKAHTNGIESFWAMLKRGYIGVYHYMSEKHLNRYVNEFSYRHNTRKFSTMEFIDSTIIRMAGKRLTYKELINA